MTLPALQPPPVSNAVCQRPDVFHDRLRRARRACGFQRRLGEGVGDQQLVPASQRAPHVIVQAQRLTGLRHRHGQQVNEIPVGDGRRRNHCGLEFRKIGIHPGFELHEHLPKQACIQ